MRYLSIFLIFILSVSDIKGDILGKELYSGVYLGGYASFDYVHKKDEDIFKIDELALILYGEFDKFDFLSEFENEGFYEKKAGFQKEESINEKIHIERAYITCYFDNNDILRVGKFNSKIGFWNQMPINVLRPTISSPYLVKRMFPKFTTGFLYSKNFDKSIKNLSFTFQHNKDLDGSYNNFNLDRHYGISLDFEISSIDFRAGGGYFRYEGFNNRYFFASFDKSGESFEWLGEFAIRIKSDDVYMHDFYIQNIWHIVNKIDIVSRGEHYEDENFAFSEFVGVLGLVFRPKENIALKGEFEAHTHISNRFLLSFSIMF